MARVARRGERYIGHTSRGEQFKLLFCIRTCKSCLLFSLLFLMTLTPETTRGERWSRLESQLHSTNSFSQSIRSAAATVAWESDSIAMLT
jgi:hypothetical protein